MTPSDQPRFHLQAHIIFLIGLFGFTSRESHEQHLRLIELKWAEKHATFA